jgi:protein SCO1/2
MGKSRFLYVITVLFLSIACTGEIPVDPMAEKQKILPIVGERDVEYKMVDGVEVADTIYPTVPSFKYIDQDSIMRTSEEFKGKIWVVDFFFTKCPTICPAMTSNMKKFSDQTIDLREHINILSFSIDPKNDTPSRLREYREIYDIANENWYMFTGNEAKTHLLAKDFYNGIQKDESIPGGYGHTPFFALVDREGYVRGIYDGTIDEKVSQLNTDVRKLLKEEYGVVGSK